MPSRTLDNPAGAFGYTANQPNAEVHSFQTSAAVSAKEIVSIGTNGKVAKSATDGDVHLVIGVALEDGASGDIIPVATKGFVPAVKTDGGDDIAAGDLLRRSGTTAGTVDSFSVDDTNRSADAIGVAVAADVDGSNTVDVWLR